MNEAKPRHIGWVTLDGDKRITQVNFMESKENFRQKIYNHLCLSKTENVQQECQQSNCVLWNFLQFVHSLQPWKTDVLSFIKENSINKWLLEPLINCFTVTFCVTRFRVFCLQNTHKFLLFLLAKCWTILLFQEEHFKGRIVPSFLQLNLSLFEILHDLMFCREFFFSSFNFNLNSLMKV